MIEIWFKPQTELDVLDYVSQIKGSYCRLADLIVVPETRPGLVAVLFDKIRDIDFELEGVSLNYDRLGNTLISLRKRNTSYRR